MPAERRDRIAGEIGALLGVRRLARLLQLVLVILVAEARDVLPAIPRRVAAEKEEEIIGVAIVAGPAELAGHVLALLQALAILTPFIGHELGVDANLGEIRLHHLADALRV